ncbi:Hypothetical protein YaeJ with similarity to translation release factor [Indibacter alkaliphilus LW1]|uniref:Prokaryotic-type class I peptide chain release factors domain-containing protein n=2 Tax=Indibacter TaxID=647744 RepID=S2DPL1_INDAL|nr:Hypothetical protein YaeJ with similarity to translation release factor [Indibacter alkaliphilus LW1]
MVSHQSMSIKDKINKKLLDNELEFQASRSSGPGGQNVNKVNSKITLKFSVVNSRVLNEQEKEMIFKKLDKKINADGELLIQVEEKRSQYQNKEIAVRKFYDLLRKAFQRRKIRKATKPGKAAIEKRLKSKKKQSEKKKNRQVDW